MATHGKRIEWARIHKEIQELTKNPRTYIKAVSRVNDAKHIYQFRLHGDGEIYKNTLLTMHVDLTIDFPFKPPVVRFTHPMYHPNVDQMANEVCSPMLSHENWKPGTTIEDILLNVLEIINDPDLSRPVNMEAAHDFIENNEKFVKKCTELARRQTH